TGLACHCRLSALDALELYPRARRSAARPASERDSRIRRKEWRQRCEKVRTVQTVKRFAGKRTNLMKPPEEKERSQGQAEYNSEALARRQALLEEAERIHQRWESGQRKTTRLRVGI